MPGQLLLKSGCLYGISWAAAGLGEVTASLFKGGDGASAAKTVCSPYIDVAEKIEQARSDDLRFWATA